MERTRGARKVPLYSSEAAEILCQPIDLAGPLQDPSSSLSVDAPREIPTSRVFSHPTITDLYCQCCRASLCGREEQVRGRATVGHMIVTCIYSYFQGGALWFGLASVEPQTKFEELCPSHPGGV